MHLRRRHHKLYQVHRLVSSSRTFIEVKTCNLLLYLRPPAQATYTTRGPPPPRTLGKPPMLEKNLSTLPVRLLLSGHSQNLCFTLFQPRSSSLARLPRPVTLAGVLVQVSRTR